MRRLRYYQGANPLYVYKAVLSLPSSQINLRAAVLREHNGNYPQ